MIWSIRIESCRACIIYIVSFFSPFHAWFQFYVPRYRDLCNYFYTVQFWKIQAPMVSGVMLCFIYWFPHLPFNNNYSMIIPIHWSLSTISNRLHDWYQLNQHLMYVKLHIHSGRPCRTIINTGLHQPHNTFSIVF